MRDIKVGDTIKCHDRDDMIETMYALEKDDIETDFLFEKNGEKGLWLEIISVKDR